MRLIDADVLLNNTDGLEHVKYSQEYGHVVLVCDIIYAQTVDVPERNVGKWIDVNEDGSLFKCSECGELQCCRSNYCGECGAKMDGKETEDG